MYQHLEFRYTTSAADVGADEDVWHNQSACHRLLQRRRVFHEDDGPAQDTRGKIQGAPAAEAAWGR